MTGPQAAQGQQWPPWLTQAFGLRPLLAAAVSGYLLWLPSHDFSKVLTMGFLMLLVLTGLRVVDPYLNPLWEQLGRINRPFRIVAGIALPIWFAISRFGPQAAGKEVDTAQSTLLITTVLAFVLLHPAPRPEQASDPS